MSWFALHIVTRERLKPMHLLAGGLLMGLSIAGMHYVGMAAMLMNPAIHYSSALVPASVVIAIAASAAALWSRARCAAHGRIT